MCGNIKIERNKVYDNLKCYAIILVVLGHALQYLKYPAFYGADMEYNNLLFRFIYMFHMPLFIYISGYFSKFIGNERCKIKPYFFNLVTTLVVPMLIWAFINIGIEYLTNYCRGGNFSVNTYLHAFFYDYWFIWTLLELKVFCWIAFRMNKWLVVSFLLVLYLWQVPFPRINFFLSLLPFFYMGHLHRMNEELIKGFMCQKRTAIIIVGGILAIICFVIFKADYTMYQSNFRIIEPVKYFDYLMYLLSGFIFICMHIMFFNIFFSKKEFLPVVGRSTLSIYLMQYAFCVLLKTYLLEFDNIFTYYLFAIVIASLWLVLSCVAIKITNLNRLIHSVLWGFKI